MKLEEHVVKCTGCGRMLPENDICDSMDEDSCDTTLSENTMEELNFDQDRWSNPYDQTDHSQLIADVVEVEENKK